MSLLKQAAGFLRTAKAEFFLSNLYRLLLQLSHVGAHLALPELLNHLLASCFKPAAGFKGL